MNTKVKVGIASVIVAALVALIVLDQKSGLPEAGKAAEDAATPVSTEAARRQEAEVTNLLRGFPNANITPPEDFKIKDAQSPARGKEIQPVKEDEYVIQEGDTYETIAEKKYGSRTLWTLIAQANPGMKASALRPGKAIKVPPKPERKAEETPRPAAPTPASADAVVVAPGGPKVYTVQSGDTLSGISQKVYSTSRHWEKLHEANRDKIADPSTLTVGLKLVVPDVVRAGPAAAGGTVQVAVPPPGSKVHAVQAGESLWKIAEKYAGDRGILDTIQTILKANADKLKDEKALLRVGWSLIVPE